MPKSQFINPKDIRKPGFIHFDDIPVHQYSLSIEDEKKIYTEKELLQVFRDMAIIREFETLLNEIKTKSVYNGVEYNNPGPAHLSLGQEASAVGEALSAIEKLSSEELYDIMKDFLDGTILNVVEGKEEVKGDVKDLAIDFLLYGALAEIFARTTGFNKGLGGSMHAFFIPFGIFPNNAIVGGSGTIAMGAALYKRSNRKPGIVVANIGDGSLGRGPVWEALCMSTMDQIKKLWDRDLGGGLPLMFNVFNNFYGMGGQTYGETMGYEFAARIGAGVTGNQMLSERVDGYNPLAVAEAYKRKKAQLLQGEGPALLDVMTYRVSGHSPSDSSTYRTQEEIDAWKNEDPILAFGNKLIAGGLATEESLAAMQESIRNRLTKIIRLAIDDTLSPRMDLDTQPNAIANLMFSHKKVEKMEDRAPDVLISKEENPRVKSLAIKVRFAWDEHGKPVPKAKTFGLRDGIFEAILDKFYEDPTLIAYGEDNRDWGGAFAVYRGLTEALPYHRFFNSCAAAVPSWN